MKYILFFIVMLPLLCFSQNKAVVAIHNTSGALVFTHTDSSKTAVPKTGFGSIYASPGQYVTFNIAYSGQGLKTISVLANQLYYPVFSTADSLLTQITDWLEEQAAHVAEFNTPAHYDMTNADTLDISASSVNSLSVFLENGDCTISINSGTPIVYDALGVYTWTATGLLDYSFRIITGSGDSLKVLTIQ